VIDGKFSVEGVPACALNAMAHYKGQTKMVKVEIKNGGSAQTEVAFVADPEPPPDIEQIQEPDIADPGDNYEVDDDGPEIEEPASGDDDPTIN
jgi:hypothetical protein